MCSLPIPRQKLADPLVRLVGDARQHVREPGLRIDAVQLAGLDQGVDRRRPLPTAIRAGEGPVAPANGDAAQRPLGRVVAQADPSILEEPGECLPVVESDRQTVERSSAGSSATKAPREPDEIDAAYGVCEAFRRAGLSPECDVSGWDGAVDARLDMSSAEARRLREPDRGPVRVRR
jgi:hypothetical protein